MADAPQRPEERRTEQALLLADEGGHRGQVVSVESVSEAEDQAERQQGSGGDSARALGRGGKQCEGVDAVLPQRCEGEHDSDAGDHQRARGGEHAPQPASASWGLQQAAGIDEREPDGSQRRRQPDAECDDQQEAEADAAQGDRAEQDDERRWAREQATRDAEREEAAPADARGLPSWREMGVPVTAVRMELGRRIRIVFVPGVVAGRAENGPETLAEEAQPEDEDDAPRDQTQDGEEALGADVVRGEQRDEAESEH